MRFGFTLAAVMVLSGQGRAGDVKTHRVSQDEARQWIRHAVPLPKQIEIASRVRLAAGEVAVEATGAADPLVRQAVRELLEALGTTEAASRKAFTIRLELGGKDADELKGLANSDQAYRIVPASNGGGLRLIATGSHGVYYASKTMQQLLKARARDGQVDVPLLRVTDWPDMADRGLWGGDSYEYLRWMSDRKLNYDEQISHCHVDRDGKCSVRLHGGKQKILDEGPTYGINGVPVVLHLEQLGNSGLFEAYPELQGKDAKEGAICYSNGRFTDILAQWLVLWRETPGVREVDVWLAENMGGQNGCQCERCVKEDRSVLEAKVVVAAWKKAREKHPDLPLRVLTSEETEKSNPKILALLPPEVKLWYYHSLFTYNTSKRGMIRGYLVNAIRDGRWVGVCPNFCATVGLWQPFTGADFIHFRFTEYAGKKLSGVIGYAVPHIHLVRFNTEAAAEWSWNVRGRSPREFAVSWAVREGMKEPEKFADWSDTHGPAAWALYGSDWPSGERRKKPGAAADMVKEGKLPPLGEVLWEVFPFPWGDFKTAEQLADCVAREKRAVQLARELGSPALLHETLYVQGNIEAIHALYQLKQVVTGRGVAEGRKDDARRWFRAYADGLTQARTALPAWEAALSGRPRGEGKTGVGVKLLDTMIEEMNAVAKELGCAGR